MQRGDPEMPLEYRPTRRRALPLVGVVRVAACAAGRVALVLDVVELARAAADLTRANGLRARLERALHRARVNGERGGDDCHRHAPWPPNGSISVGSRSSPRGPSPRARRTSTMCCARIAPATSAVT